ncbi:MAG: APC family permease [Bryobacteraceae bacterium]
MPEPSVSSSPTGAAHLKRSLGLLELVLIGIIMVQPTAPMPPFGAFFEVGHGQVVTTVLLAMVAMLFTAISYGRMARIYPSAGSAYAYVAQEIHPGLGFATGWSMLMDYMLNPLICIIWGSQEAHEYLIRSVPCVVWAVFFTLLFTWANLRRVRTTARINAIMAIAMGVVIVAMLVCTTRHVMGLPELNLGVFTHPFYDPRYFSWKLLGSGSSLAVLTYIGFDGISTLSEETKNPRRNILLAMVLTCVIIGVLSAIEVYAAQLVWPVGKPFSSVETAYTDVARLVGGPALAFAMTITLLVANFGSGSGAQLAGARLLYGMGRSRALPKGFFGAVNPKSNVPANNVILVGALALIGSFLISYTDGAELLNFGALIGFAGVTLAAFLHYYVRAENKHITHFVPPLLGFFICIALWLNLDLHAKLLGFAWLAIGMAYGWWKTKGFRTTLDFEIPPE